MRVRYKLVNSKGIILFNGLTHEEIAVTEKIDPPSQQVKIGNITVRAGVARSAYGTVFGVTEDKDYLKSTKKFNDALKALSETLLTFENLVSDLRQQQNTNTSRLLHNLVTLNAHNIQEIYSLIPQDVLTKTAASKQVQMVEKIVKTDSKDTAISLLRIAKNNASMKTEFSVFNKLFDSNPRLEKKHHNIHKVLMNILYLFFPDFTDKNVIINVECPENTIAFFDYESIHVALYHLIENAVKYVKSNTDVGIFITSSGDIVSVVLRMYSLEIAEHEVEAIFEDGYSGEASKQTGKCGSGIGMGRVKDILNINQAKISVQIYPSTKHQYRNATYQMNTFRIDLPTKP